MLQKCVSLDPAYTPAYLVLARLATGPAAGVLLRHVVRLQPRSPDHLAEYASWLYQTVSDSGKTTELLQRDKPPASPLRRSKVRVKVV